MVKWLAAIVLTVSLGCWGFARLSLASHFIDTEPRQPVQNMVSQNLNGTYSGKVYFRDKKNRQYLLLGPALLEVKDKTFVLCKSIKDSSGKEKCSGQKFTGEISFSTIPEKANLGVGGIKPKSEDRIETRWYHDPDRKILKIVRANGAKREFRFCSNINKAQCFGKI
ncbi:MAG TPA: hypothetical protein VHQ94_17235 [Pyrinomonadaceae bacterium]|jgi:hypothetical protein|nr:hypothetical protein [Pyrinomonadaceae bacterium]